MEQEDRLCHLAEANGSLLSFKFASMIIVNRAERLTVISTLTNEVKAYIVCQFMVLSAGNEKENLHTT